MWKYTQKIISSCKIRGVVVPQKINKLTRTLTVDCIGFEVGALQARGKSDDAKQNLSSLFKPVQIKPNTDDINVGVELVGKLNKGDVLQILNQFTQKKQIKDLCKEHGLDCNIINFL